MLPISGGWDDELQWAGPGRAGPEPSVRFGEAQRLTEDLKSGPKNGSCKQKLCFAGGPPVQVRPQHVCTFRQ